MAFTSASSTPIRANRGKFSWNRSRYCSISSAIFQHPFHG
nr:MAG TPA: hypothetical protein [Caudoviricetes sp.]